MPWYYQKQPTVISLGAIKWCPIIQWSTTNMLTLFWVGFLQHAVVFVNGDQYYGAKASINVWAPRVTDQYEFSLSQIWVISGSFGHDLNTIEAGWQVCLFLLILKKFK